MLSMLKESILNGWKTRDEMADHLSVHPRTLWAMTKTGELLTTKLNGRRWYKANPDWKGRGIARSRENRRARFSSTQLRLFL